MPVTLDRTWLNAQVDDSGSGTDGSILDKADFTAIYDAIDVALAAVGGGAPGGSDTYVQFNDAGAFGGDAGLTYNKTTDRLTAGALTTGAANSYVNDNSNANMAVGLTINQGTNDDEALALKSSDIAHGITDAAETDTYFTAKKANATQGGVHLRGYAATTIAGTIVEGNANLTDGTRNTASEAFIKLRAALKSGTSVTSVGADKNLIVIQDNGTTRFIFDSDGDSHQDVGTAWTNFDAHDDVLVLNVLAAYVTRPDDPLKAVFGEWLLQSRQMLERLRLVTFNDDGHHFVNMSRLTMLLVGAVRQVGRRLEQLEQRCRALEARHG